MAKQWHDPSPEELKRMQEREWARTAAKAARKQAKLLKREAKRDRKSR